MTQKNGSGKTVRVSMGAQKVSALISHRSEMTLHGNEHCRSQVKGEKVEVKLPALSPLSPNKKVKDPPMPSKPTPVVPNGGAKAVKAPSPKSPSKPTTRNTPTRLSAPIKTQSIQSTPPHAAQGEPPEEDTRSDANSSVSATEDRSASPTFENVRLDDSEAVEKAEEGPSIFAEGLSVGVAEPSPDGIAAAEAAAAALRKLDGNGMVKLVYEQYDELFPIEDGSTTQANIDEVYCLSFVMPLCLVRLSRHPTLERFQREENGIFDSLVREDPRGTYHDLEKEQTYYVVVDQEADQLRRDQEATKVLWDRELQKQKKVDKDDGRGFETCSCIYGNPCVDEYGCRDWHSRLAVATKNGWKGF
ncbi:hypothetical protein PRIC2_000088 [Phytophthora ramorum]